MLMLSFLSEIYFMLVTALTTKKPGGLAHVKACIFLFTNASSWSTDAMDP